MSEQTTYPSLAKKTVLVTGGASGIGAALVRAFAHQGARVGFIDIDDSEGRALAGEIEVETGREPWFTRVDVTDTPALKEAFSRAVASIGPIHVLLNNVGNDSRHSPQDITEDDWQKCLDINLGAAFFASQTTFDSMRAAGGGSIVNISSINALLGPANMPGYVAAKAGLIGLTKALAKDYGAANIRVNAILPGWVATDRQLDTWLTPDRESEWMKQVPLKRRLREADVASLALFLAADDSDMITGQSLAVDGGRT